jgi:hypothetical protein
MNVTTQKTGAVLATPPGMVTRRRRSGDMADHTANPPTVPFGYCHCGCGRKTNLANKNDSTSGRVKGVPMRYLRGHQGRKNTPEYREEDRGFTSPCWTWLRGKTTNGYGIARRAATGKKALYAHRLYYEVVMGAIPAGMEIDHLCRNRDCVNPDHLESVTPAVNSQRGNCAKLTPQQIEEIRAFAPHSTKADLARQYGITPTNVSTIVRRESWKEIA